MIDIIYPASSSFFFFAREICTYNSLSFIFLNFFSYSLFLTFTLCDFCVPTKHGFLNIFSLQADMNCFYLNTCYSVLTFLYFYTITNFDSLFYYYDYFHCYCCYYYFCHCHCHYYFFIFNALSFYYCRFYHSVLSLYISKNFDIQRYIQRYY